VFALLVITIIMKNHEKHGLNWKNNLLTAEIIKNEGLPPNRAGSSVP
jgi:hypothetical protein